MSVKTTSGKEKKSVLTIGLHHQFFNVILLFCKVTPMGSEKKTPQRSLLVDLLIVLFGVSSWVAVNGLWVELPVLVKILPESWELASYIVVTSQVANLGPILFSAARKIWSQKVLEIPFIHGSLALVIISSILLSIFWDTTTYIGNELHSTALLALTFFMSLVDCTSSLLYLPFIANFKEQYVISYLVGAGLSGPIPGLLALAQGVGGYAQCINVTVTNVTESGNFTEYHIEPYYAPPRFSTNIFFALLSAQMVVSWIAFVLLNKLPSVKKEKVSFIPVIQPKHPAVDENFQSSTDASVSFEKTASSEQNLLGRPFISHSQYIFLLGIQGFVSALHNGVLLSVQTYSCLPYGSIAYHLTVTLSSIANPLSCFLAMFLPVYSVRAVAGLTVCGTCWAAYILATALLSPNPPFVGTTLGACLVVIAWVLVCGLVAFIKACIAAILRRQGGQTALYRCGVVTQIGSAIGAVTIFLLLRYTDFFRSYSPCS